MGKVRYYDPHSSTLASIFSWRATCFELVLKRPEFYVYIVWNILLTAVCIWGIEAGTIDTFNWDAASIMQYVMTFFVTFYNDRCYERYERLYPACCEFMDGTKTLIEEMNVSLHWRDLTYHRIAITKYLLAVTQEYFMIVCGGSLQKKSWDVFIEKGLLTPEEIKILHQFPGGESTCVLTSWALFIVRDALVQDCMWRMYDDNEMVSQQTVHIYNRHVRHIINLQQACHRIGYTMANPIPFAYYHLMNVILIFNIMLLGTFSALHRSFASAIPFGTSLVIYMGLREISTALADPFGEDSVDFPIPDYIRTCFDSTVSLLLAFMRTDVRQRVLDQIKHVEDFKETSLRLACKKSLTVADPNEPKKGNASITKWSMRSVFEKAKTDVNIIKKLKLSLSPVNIEDGEGHFHIAENPRKDQKRQANKQINTLRNEREDLHNRLQALETEYEKIVHVIMSLTEQYPQLHDHGPTFDLPDDLREVKLDMDDLMPVHSFDHGMGLSDMKRERTTELEDDGNMIADTEAVLELAVQTVPEVTGAVQAVA